jgi:hypothetical protein
LENGLTVAADGYMLNPRFFLESFQGAKEGVGECFDDIPNGVRPCAAGVSLPSGFLSFAQVKLTNAVPASGTMEVNCAKTARFWWGTLSAAGYAARG